MTVTLDIGIYISESMHHRVVSHSSPLLLQSTGPQHDGMKWMVMGWMKPGFLSLWAWLWFLIIIGSSSDWPEPGLGLTSISLSYGNFKPKHRQFSLWTMRKIKFELSWIEHQIFIPTPAATEMWWHLVCCGLKSEGFDISGDNLHKQHSS